MLSIQECYLLARVLPDLPSGADQRVTFVLVHRRRLSMGAA